MRGAAAMDEKEEVAYFKVLERNKKKLSDYETVHFRRKSVSRSRYERVKQPRVPDIVLFPKRPPKPQVVPFDKTNAALYLRQTESLWLHTKMSRQEATKMLFDKPTGSFVVRGSQRARYALSLRLRDSDPAVSHFLIHTNQQGFLTVQGSNLPFLSVYDLLAYFCFNQSGGMPCLLQVPKPGEDSKAEESADSSDSEEESSLPYQRLGSFVARTSTHDDNQVYDDATSIQHKARAHYEFAPQPRKSPPPSSPPPPVPPRSRGPTLVHSPDTGRRMVQQTDRLPVIDSYPLYEDIVVGAVPVKKKAPPKPPRTWLPEEMGGEGTREEVEAVVKRVSPIVDADVQHLLEIATPTNMLPSEERLHMHRRSLSSDDALHDRPHISSLINLFEKRSTSSPGLRPSLLQRSHSNLPLRPPKPSAPPVPPKPLAHASPIIPPRTPAPLLPPKPDGSQPPNPAPRSRVRSHSHAAISGTPPLPPRNRSRSGSAISAAAMKEEPVDDGEDSDDQLAREEREMEEQEALVASTQESQLPGSSQRETDASVPAAKASGSKWRPGWAKKLKKFNRKPRKKIKAFILELKDDPSHDFGRQISEFINDMRIRSSTEPHQKMLAEIRAFMTKSHNTLLSSHQPELLAAGMASCPNVEHVIETALQQSVLQPLSHFVYLRIEEFFTSNGSMLKVQRSIFQGKAKSPTEMGVRRHLVVPGEKVVAEISNVFNRLRNTSCAISKLEYLLEAVRLTYENVRDSRQPKKSMHDLGADDFLPLFVWVLVQCDFFRAEIEAEYMWGLAHPSLFNGEAGYYLTTLTSAVNVLKESAQAPASPPSQVTQLPCMNNLQTELKVFFEDENTGQFSSAYHLPIIPDMMAAEICEILAEKHGKTNADDYALFTVVDGQATMLKDEERPQEIKMNWALERTARQAAHVQPVSRLIAYKLRSPANK